MVQRGLLWKEDEMGELVPTWTMAPGISIIKSLAVKHLPGGYTNINATFLAEGSFNKLYCITSPNLPQQYLMRVALPVEPFFNNGEQGCHSCVHPSIYHDPCAERASLLLVSRE